ncbi:SYPL1 protein, partial [Toxostoma redivivum]|nr:SYPL1 protein [Toxostoma redivivum]
QFFSIFAFATCGGFEGSVTFRVTCEGRENHSVSAAFGYPFRLNQAVFQPSLTHLCNHTWPKDVHLVGDFSSASRFFVGVAVAAFLYSLGALGGYLGYLHLYRCAGSRLPLMVSDLPVQVSCTWA